MINCLQEARETKPNIAKEYRRTTRLKAKLNDLELRERVNKQIQEFVSLKNKK